VYYWELFADIGHLLWSQNPIPLRDETLASLTFGNPGGQARAKTQELLLVAMKKMHAAGEETSSEFAAQVMARLLLGDPRFPVVPEWLKEELEYHEEAVKECLEEEPGDGAGKRVKFR
jgi:hypothetical protein